MKLGSFLETKLNPQEVRLSSVYRNDKYVSKDVARILHIALYCWNDQPFMPNRSALCDALIGKRQKAEDKTDGSEAKRRRIV
jgi:hypothetical protein